MQLGVEVGLGVGACVGVWVGAVGRLVGSGTDDDGTVLGPAVGGDWLSLQPATTSAVKATNATGRLMSATLPHGAVDRVAGVPGQRRADVVQMLDLLRA